MQPLGGCGKAVGDLVSHVVKGLQRLAQMFGTAEAELDPGRSHEKCQALLVLIW